MDVDFGALLGTKDLDTLLSEFLEGYRNAGGQVTNLNIGGPFRTLAESALSPQADLYVLLAQVAPQGFATYATGQWLDVKVSEVGITRLLATKATGNVTIAPADTTSPLLIPAGSVVATEPGPDGTVLRYFVTADTVIAGGQATGTVPVQAEFAGCAYNVGQGYITVLETYIPGVASVTNGADWITSGGTDDETDEALRERYFLKWDELAQGGTDDSYRGWARNAGAVSVAVNSQAPRGQGTVDVIITGPTGAPSADLISQVQAYIDQRRPNVADVLVKGPTAVTVDVVATIVMPADTGDAAAAQAAAAANIQAYFGNGEVSGIAARGIGDSAYVLKLGSLLLVSNVVTAQVTTPAADVIVQPDELTVLGNLIIAVERQTS